MGIKKKMQAKARTEGPSTTYGRRLRQCCVRADTMQMQLQSTPHCNLVQRKQRPLAHLALTKQQNQRSRLRRLLVPPEPKEKGKGKTKERNVTPQTRGRKARNAAKALSAPQLKRRKQLASLLCVAIAGKEKSVPIHTKRTYSTRLVRKPKHSQKQAKERVRTTLLYLKPQPQSQWLLALPLYTQQPRKPVRPHRSSSVSKQECVWLPGNSVCQP